MPNDEQDFDLTARETAQTSMTRRGFLMTTLAAGFALAVQPISAETIITDTAGLDAGEIKIPTAKESIPAYRALPAGRTQLPVVLVVHEAFGVHAHIQDVCRRLAKQGYLAVAPDLFARQGDVSKLADISEIVKLLATVPDAQVMADLDATVGWVHASGVGNRERLGITGFCWGGRIVWLYCAHSRQVKAGVAWYGRLAGKPTDRQPRHPIDLAGSLQAPVLGLYGGADQGIPVESVEQMQSALKTAGTPSRIIVYPNTPHAFFADYRPSYRAEQAQDGWKRLLEWLRQHGVA